MTPTFVGIGAQKCASSWLYDILSDHPQALLSKKKELDFFTYHYENGYTWYENNFPPGIQARAIGEISPSYFHEASAPERVRRYLADARILVSLRDPVERALSQHRHLARIGLLTGPDFTFERGVAANPSYIEQGMYATHLRRWRQYFPAEQILVVLMDDICTDARSIAGAVYKFLRIDPTHVSKALHERSNPSYVVRNRVFDLGVKELRRVADSLGLMPLWRAMGDTGLRRMYRAFNRRPSQTIIPHPKPETLIHLRAHFRPEVEALEDMLGRELSRWKEP